MAETDATERETTDETTGNGSDGGGGAGRTAVRAAAIAAVSGATALAAKKAFGDRGGGDRGGEDKPERSQRKRGSNDVLGSMMTSAWDSARDSVVPMLENAATSAGEYLARSGPELVRETIVPRFIDGFERGRGSDED